jgi:hypothetical protein
VSNTTDPLSERLAKGFLDALKHEKDPEVQCSLIGSFFMRMKHDPSLIDVMLKILQDPGKNRKVRDQALNNLQVLHKNVPHHVKIAIEAYQKENTKHQ